MPSVKLPSGVVHYSDEGQGLPGVLLHANRGDSRDFAAVIPVLAETNRILSLDWPGYGESEFPPESDSVVPLFF